MPFRLRKYAAQLEADRRWRSRPLWYRIVVVGGFLNFLIFIGVFYVTTRSGTELPPEIAKYEEYVLRDHHRFFLVEPWVYYGFNAYEMISMLLFFASFGLGLWNAIDSLPMRAGAS